ncbi:unnamed protein product, partial [Polarella glacialis]
HEEATTGARPRSGSGDAGHPKKKQKVRESSGFFSGQGEVQALRDSLVSVMGHLDLHRADSSCVATSVVRCLELLSRWEANKAPELGGAAQAADGAAHAARVEDSMDIEDPRIGNMIFRAHHAQGEEHEDGDEDDEEDEEEDDEEMGDDEEGPPTDEEEDEDEEEEEGIDAVHGEAEEGLLHHHHHHHHHVHLHDPGEEAEEGEEDDEGEYDDMDEEEEEDFDPAELPPELTGHGRNHLASVLNSAIQVFDQEGIAPDNMSFRVDIDLGEAGVIHGVHRNGQFRRMQMPPPMAAGLRTTGFSNGPPVAVGSGPVGGWSEPGDLDAVAEHPLLRREP